MKLTSVFIISGALLLNTASFLQAASEEKTSPLESHVVELANHSSGHFEQIDKMSEELKRKTCDPLRDPRCN